MCAGFSAYSVQNIPLPAHISLVAFHQFSCRTQHWLYEGVTHSLQHNHVLIFPGFETKLVQISVSGSLLNILKKIIHRQKMDISWVFILNKFAFRIQTHFRDGKLGSTKLLNNSLLFLTHMFFCQLYLLHDDLFPITGELK